MEEEGSQMMWGHEGGGEETQEDRHGETEEEWQREGGKGAPIALRLRQREKKRGREQKSDSLTATPNGFSGEKEREGVQRRRRRHNEGAMIEAEIDLERWMEGETKRGGGYMAIQ